ncbi:MAG TPA: malonate-semialdehyde dehydrogenase, partial [Desulfobulbaceae bacterium]|nr:malonate-semialdehyde dehydrogenase [Desulfobulbaceae bacterium]
MTEIKKLKYFAGGKWLETESGKYMDVYNPSVGEVMAQTPCCTEKEVDYAVECAQKAFPGWAATPAAKRVQVLYKFRDLIEKNLDELTRLCATEHGKVWD